MSNQHKTLCNRDWIVISAPIREVGDGGAAGVPHPFGATDRGSTALEDSMALAAALGAQARVVPVVLEQHRPWWGPQLSPWPEVVPLAQPFDRGTAPGLLLALRRIRDVDPEARVTVLFTDTPIPDEAAAQRALDQALARLIRGESVVVMEADDGGAPSLGLGQVGAWVDLFERLRPDLTQALPQEPDRADPEALRALYLGLPFVELDEDILQQRPSRVPADLGPLEDHTTEAQPH